MVLSLIDLQVRLRYALVEHRIRLADTAADLISHRAVIDAVRRLKTALRRSSADIVIEVELLARLEHEAVEFFADETDIRVTVIVVCCFRSRCRNEAEDLF